MSQEDPIKYTSDGVAIPESLSGKGLSRRQLLQAMGVTAGAGALAMTGLGQAPHAAAATARRTGTMADLKHVVIMMQENRSFDHYFGTLSLAGARGYGDKQAMRLQNGKSNFFTPDPSRTDGGYLLPFRLQTGKVNAQNDGGTPLGYFTEEDIPWQHALAKAFTVCDHNHCSLNTSTDPNRIMMWTGTNDPTGANGGPSINNNNNGQFKYTWQTYPEVLQKAGVTWQIYTNNDISTNWLGDFEDNLLRDFAPFNPANANAENTVPRQGLLARANVLQTHTTPPAGVPNSPADLDYVLKDFIADCASGSIPEISWVVSPASWSEHPPYAPDYGAVYVNRVIKALHDNPELWDSTLLIITYDENNGSYFDHVLAPAPEPGTPGEFAPGLRPGLGQRVPMILVSPWTRGGWVSSETVDHTSLIQIMEKWTTFMGKPAICPNISDWRRSICGDLTSAIDFGQFDNSLPELPAASVLAAAADGDASLPKPAPPATGEQTFPVQPTEGPLKLRPVPYQQHAGVSVDRSTGKVTATMTNTGGKAVSMQVFPDDYLPFTGTPNTVSKAGSKTYDWDTTKTGGNYAFSIYGPDRFVRSFAGTVIHAGQNVGQVPHVDAEIDTDHAKTLKITLTNEGHTQVRYTLTPNDYEGNEQTVYVDYGRHATVNWPTNEYGYYDVIITANTTDGFTYRYAGRIS